jgi:hypothetical protein
MLTVQIGTPQLAVAEPEEPQGVLGQSRSAIDKASSVTRDCKPFRNRLQRIVVMLPDRGYIDRLRSCMLILTEGCDAK